MEIESTTSHGKTAFSARGCGWFKALFGRSEARIAGVMKRTKKLGQDDPRRIIHSVKVALALTFVSLIYYTRPLYDGFGVAGIWAVLTVVVVFEFTVGGTLSRCLNRGLATLSAGALGVGANYLASLLGEKEEPILLGFFVFLLAVASTFIRFFPHIKKRYDYGVLIFILTFSLVTVSGYRVDKIIELANQRVSTIFIGGSTCMIISLFICPVWAGEDLHRLVALNMEKLATFLEGFGGEYFKLSEDGNSDNISRNDKASLQGYKSVLYTKPTEESLANFAWWEPGHGNFGLRHPWKQYLKIGVLIRQCAYHIEALNGYLNSEIQAPSEFQRRLQEPCTKMSSESGKALKVLASSLRAMKYPSAATSHIQNCKTAIDDLKATLEASSLGKSNLMEIIPAVTVASLLIDISKCVEKVSESVHELSNKVCFKNVKSTLSSEKSQILHRGTVTPISGRETDHVLINVNESSSDSPDIGNPQGPKQIGM